MTAPQIQIYHHRFYISKFYNKIRKLLLFFELPILYLTFNTFVNLIMSIKNVMNLFTFFHVIGIIQTEIFWTKDYRECLYCSQVNKIVRKLQITCSMIYLSKCVFNLLKYLTTWRVSPKEI